MFCPEWNGCASFCPGGAVNATSVDHQTDEIVAQTVGVDTVCCGNRVWLILHSSAEGRQQLLLHLQTFKPLTSPTTPLELWST